MRLLPVLVLIATIARPAAAVTIPTDFVDEPVAGDLTQPINFDFLPDGRVLIVERTTATIRLVVPGAAVQPGPVGTIPDVVFAYVEQGLLGIAVDPRWPEKPYIYLHSTKASTPNIEVVRYALTGDLTNTAGGELTMDPASRREILPDLPSDFNLHNGGTLQFGPEGLLYVALGDDGIRCSAQDRHQMRGKILRLDVRVVPDGPGPVRPYYRLVPEGNPYFNDADPRAGLVWHRGLRNPWSFDFDPKTGLMAIADVGLDRWEELDIVPSGAHNFGWPMFEGPVAYDPNCLGVEPTSLTSPAYAYPHVPPAGSSAIVGGICFPADSIAGSFPYDHWGDVFFLDLYAGRLQRLEQSGETWGIAEPIAGQPDADAWGTGFEFVPRMRFGRDGGLWYVRGTELRRISYHGALLGVPGADPGGAALSLAAFPSPARGPVTVEYVLPRAGDVRIDVFDARGRHVRRVVEQVGAPPGRTRQTWDGCDDDGARVRPGVYFLRLAVAGQVATQRLVVMAP